MDKILAFEYFVLQLHKWYKESNHDLQSNDLGTLKVLKLLFFTSAVGTSANASNPLIDNIFNNYVAMPYGHVESDVYNFIKNKTLINVSFEGSTSRILHENKILELQDSIKILIDNQLKLLKQMNAALIKYESFNLVDLSHKWYSWQKNYKIAQQRNAFSAQICVEEIKGEVKIYQ